MAELIDVMENGLGDEVCIYWERGMYRAYYEYADSRERAGESMDYDKLTSFFFRKGFRW